MTSISDLYDFIDRAKSDRKYAENTAFGLKTAVRLFEEIMNDEEKASIEVVDKRIDALADDLYGKNKTKFSSKTVVAYKKRLAKVISDYAAYGSSAEKMAAWNPRRPQKAVGEKQASAPKKAVQNTGEDDSIEIMPSFPRTVQYVATPFELDEKSVNKSEFSLREDFRVTLALPADMTTKEADKVKRYVDAMVGGD